MYLNNLLTHTYSLFNELKLIEHEKKKKIKKKEKEKKVILIIEYNLTRIKNTKCNFF